MKFSQNNWPKSVLVTLSLILVLLFHLPGSIASDLNPVRTPSTGYQPQFQVSGDRIYYVWHEYDGPYRQIFTSEMNIDGTGWKAVKRTSSPFDKFEPQLQVVGEKIHFVWREFDGSHFQIWTAVLNYNGVRWQAVKRTHSPYDKHNPQLQVDGENIYYVWHEDHGPIEPIWSAVETLTNKRIDDSLPEGGKG